MSLCGSKLLKQYRDIDFLRENKFIRALVAIRIIFNFVSINKKGFQYTPKAFIYCN